MAAKITRRRFIKYSILAGSALGVGLGGRLLLSENDPVPFTPAPPPSQRTSGSKAPRVIFISVDSLDPRYLYLNSLGQTGGRDGDWLMPQVRKFLEGGVWFEHTRCHMPAITDPNHLNALAGTSTAQTGLNSVSLQFFDWKEDGSANIVTPSLSFVRDDQGRPVDTLFSAWKRKWPSSRTFFSSGKEWVARMFDVPDSGVDIIMGGSRYPGYIDPPPKGYRFYDPPGNVNLENFRASSDQKTFSRVVYENNPTHFPPDMWLVNSTLKMLGRELPDFGVVLLAQMDDLQHGLGSAWDPGEFDSRMMNGRGPIMVSRINPTMVFQKAVLDGVRDVDRHFGRLVEGIRSMPNYRDAILVLYSDHGHLTHRSKETIQDIFMRSVFGRYDRDTDTNLVDILARAGVIQGGELDYRGFCPITGSSVGAVFFRGPDLGHRLGKARLAQDALLHHRVKNPITGGWECPWDVLTMTEMEKGLPGVSEPGELYHPHFARNNQPGTLHWPDLMLVAKNNWQLPAVMGLLTNVGVKIPGFIVNRMAPWRAMIGGHGSADTQKILMAIEGPGAAKGKVVSDPDFKTNYRLADLAVTLADILGLELRSSTIGHNRSREIKNI